MAKKKTTPKAGSLPAIHIGMRVRCTDDGVEGRIRKPALTIRSLSLPR
jgi:hypothetical protein